MVEDEIKKKLDNILFEIRWMQRNMNPPVNYSLIVICSVIASVITTYVMSKVSPLVHLPTNVEVNL